MTNSEEWYGKMADNENSILKESYGNMTLSSSVKYKYKVKMILSYHGAYEVFYEASH